MLLNNFKLFDWRSANGVNGQSSLTIPNFKRNFISADLGSDATFTRAGTAYATDYLGQQVLLPANTPRFDGARTAWNRLGSIDFNVSGSYWVDYNGNGTVVTPGFTDPEGGSTAYRLVIPSVGSSGVRAQLAAANTFYAKQYVRGSVWLRSDTPVTLRIYGTATAGGGGVDITTSTEWKRYSAVGPVTIATPLRGLHIIKVDNAGATVYAWNPQTELAYSANQPPSEWLDPAGNYGSGQLGRKWFTTTNGNTVGAGGVVTEATGTPISGISYYPEIPRTNIALGSTNFDAAGTYWSNLWTGSEKPSIFSGGIAYQGVSIASGGTLRAQTIATTAATWYTVSTYLEMFAGSPYPVQAGVNNADGTPSIWSATGRWRYDVDTDVLNWAISPGGSNPFVSRTLLGTGPNGGQVIRVDHTFYSDDLADQSNAYTFYLGSTSSPVANGTNIIHGIQYEAGKFATSMIPTTSAAVTRAAGTLDYALSGVNAGFTVVVDMEYPFDPALYGSTNDGSLFGTDDSGGITSEVRTAGSNNYNIITYVDGGAACNTKPITTGIGRHKFAFAAENGIGQFTYLDGVAKLSQLAPAYPEYTLDHTDQDTWNVGHWNGNYFTGKINSITIYDHCLSEAELAQVSSL